VPQSPFEKFRLPTVTFVGEQDGAVERDFKNRVSLALQGRVKAAFLARVVYPENSESSVALCLTANSEEAGLVEETAAIFKGMFGAHEHLDIVFLRPPQELELRRVCSPFIGDPNPAE
jgi:hypothetical protein